MKLMPRLSILICALLLILSGCGNSPSSSDNSVNEASEGLSQQEITDSTPVDNVDYDQLINDLYLICYNQPETLASTMSCFPSLLRACSITTDDPLAIDDLISNDENGGEVQENLMFQLQGLLEDPETELAVASWTGRALLLGMETIDPAQPLTPANIRLSWYEQDIEDGQILGVAHPLDSGDKEFGYFYLPGGFQRLVPVLD